MTKPNKKPNTSQNPNTASFMDNVNEATVNLAQTGKNFVKATKSDKKAKIDNKNQDTAKQIHKNIDEVLNSKYQVVSLYVVAMLWLVALILWTAVQTVEQVQAYHHEYGQLQSLKKEFRHLQIERQRMLIEQQTFSATPQVTSRAVVELNMFYPNVSDRLIINSSGQVITSDEVEKKETTLTIDPTTQH